MKILLSLYLALGLSYVASAVQLQSGYAVNNSSQCLTVNRSDPNTWRFDRNVEVGSCFSGDNQQFFANSLSGVGNGVRIEVMGRCLDIDVSGEDWADGNNIVVNNCSNAATQLFRIEPRDKGWFIVRSVADGRCLDIDLNTSAGWRYQRNVALWNCTGESNQLWNVLNSNGGFDGIGHL